MIIDLGRELHENPDGDTDSDILEGLLLLASNWIRPALGEHVTESAPLPDPAEARKLMTSGFTVHAALGEVGANTTEA